MQCFQFAPTCSFTPYVDISASVVFIVYSTYRDVYVGIWSTKTAWLQLLSHMVCVFFALVWSFSHQSFIQSSPVFHLTWIEIVLGEHFKQTKSWPPQVLPTPTGLRKFANPSETSSSFRRFCFILRMFIIRLEHFPRSCYSFSCFPSILLVEK